MADVGSIQSGGASATASILQAAEQNTAVAVALLKKTTDADKDLVNTLLPLPAAGPGGVDIRA
jgi:hypothetical protein